MRTTGNSQKTIARQSLMPSIFAISMQIWLASLFLLTILTLPLLGDDASQIVRFKRMGWNKTDFSKRGIKLDEIMSGGPSRDGIPPVDKPVFKPISEITTIADREPVIGLEINGDARAYPVQILMWHEIVNDTIGSKPVTVTFCPLCNAAIVFERTIDGNVLDFGTTGLLRNSDLVMYDRQSESWWQQFSGTSIVGQMLGKELVVLPTRLESFKNFKKRFPKGKVLVPSLPGMRNYGANPYTGYDSMAKPFLYNGEMPEGMSPMERVVVFKKDGKKVAYALSLLAKKGTLTTGNVTVSWQAGQASALDGSSIAKSRDIGNIVVQEDRSGKKVDIAYDVIFAFVVKAFLPNLKIIKN
jgi:hypothetical protein